MLRSQSSEAKGQRSSRQCAMCYVFNLMRFPGDAEGYKLPHIMGSRPGVQSVTLHQLTVQIGEQGEEF